MSTRRRVIRSPSPISRTWTRLRSVRCSRSRARRSPMSSRPAAANVITGGTGNDRIDGGGGADVISGGLGDDTITYYGAEVSIDGGAGNDTLVVSAGSPITAVNLSVASGVDQTTGDKVLVTNF